MGKQLLLTPIVLSRDIQLSLPIQRDHVVAPSNTRAAAVPGKVALFPPPQLCNAQLMSHLTLVRQGLLNTEVLSRALLFGVFCHARLTTQFLFFFIVWGCCLMASLTEAMIQALKMLCWEGFD